MRRATLAALVMFCSALPAQAHPEESRSWTYTTTDTVAGTVSVLDRGRPVANLIFFATELGLAKDNAVTDDIPDPGAWFEFGRLFAKHKAGTSKPSAISLDGIAGTGRWTVAVPGLGTAKMRFSKVRDDSVAAVSEGGYWWSRRSDNRYDEHSWGYAAVITKAVLVKVTGKLGKYDLTSDDPTDPRSQHRVLIGPSAAVITAADYI